MGWIHGPEPRVFAQGAAMSGPLCRRAMPGETSTSDVLRAAKQAFMALRYRCLGGSNSLARAFAFLWRSGTQAAIWSARVAACLCTYRHARAASDISHVRFLPEQVHPPASQVHPRRRYRSPTGGVGLEYSRPSTFSGVVSCLVAF